ncbi:regulator of sirC expression with transglutaminase-like and TPR domain [Oceanisphaera litoralis]|uniref:SirB1 family protein n=1 Tax=Oceanisphaera litoralis TaxID=225144 RepID=UPI001959326A|nr:tetratricopeptide repeat protein [Oceanisphaera litoralis]MBM7457072.1 regulator of sirC expression with transglutaminase-like and TPR domain [Oceanisphaera litoralis]
MLKTNISDGWSSDDPRSLMMLALDVVESLYGLKARDQAEVSLFALERELAEQLKDQSGPMAQQLLSALYGPLGVAGDWERFFSTDNCLMNRVLSRRRGIPVTLGILLLHLCEGFGIRAEGIGFPGHFLVRVLFDDEGLVIDPFTGRPLSRHEMEQLLRGARGNLARIKPGHLKAAENLDILTRLLNVTKASFIHHKQFSQALACSQLLLKLKPDCPFERRDRGFLYEQLDCDRLAADDFEFFIEHCPEDPVADVLKAQILALDLGPQTLH